MIERLKNIRKNYTGEDDEALMWAIECIRHVPKQGEWIDKTTMTDMHTWFECSVCGTIFPFRNMNYCPNCGARMEDK